MYEIVYQSKASDDLVDKDIKDILTSAHKYNAKNSVTGCLLYYKREFIQILEGEEEIIKPLFDVIYQDDRHKDVLLLSEGEKAHRAFSDFSMAYHELSDAEAHSISEQLFKSNFVAFSELVEKSTFSSILFWSLARKLLGQ